jgi:hypothetical protein
MSFSARVFRILIASPSDVEQEREIAVRTIQAWNDLNSSERQIVLLPLRWETHSAPEYGRRPQDVINRQVVDHSDLLVGIFWTRVGSPTGIAESGTLEEIERVANQGKTVMLYFSQVKQEPDRIDPEQLKRVRDFRQKTFPKALVETYSTTEEFRDKLAKQLEIQLRTLIAEESRGDVAHFAGTPTTEIQFEFADVESGKRIGHALEVQSTFIELEDTQAIPDFIEDKQVAKRDGETHTFGLYLDSFNKNYYREMASYLVRQNFFRTIRFWLKNEGGLGARDVYVDIRIASDGGDILTVRTLEGANLAPPSKSSIFRAGAYTAFDETLSTPEQLGNQWNTAFEIRALQPQGEVSPPIPVAIGTSKTTLITLTARIYADTLSEPVARELQIMWTVNTVRKRAIDFLDEAGIKVEPRTRPGGRQAAE